jgi:TolA-binding protein
MAFLWQSFLILFALVLSGGQIFAASATKEQRDFAAAVGAFNDSMYPRAETEFDQFRKSYPNSTNASQASLMQAQAEFKQGKFSGAIALLADADNMAKAGNLADQYVYWTGEAQFQNTNYPAASETFVSLVQNFPRSPLRLRAVVEAASAYVQLSGWSQTVSLLEETNGVFQRAAQMDSANELVSRGRLLLAQAKFALKDFDGEFAVLTSLNSQTLKPELDWQRAYLLYQNRNAAGDFDAALTVTTNLLRLAQIEKNNGAYAESVAMHANALEKSGLTNEAIAAYQENLTNSAPVVQQRQAVLKIAELAIAQKQIPVATNALETFLSQFPDSPAADIVVLTLGELHLKNYVAQPSVATNDLPEAQARFGQFIGAFTNSPLTGKAFLDRGWSFWIAQKIPESLADFQMAADNLPFSEDLAVAKFKLGDALFAESNFAGARTNYESVVDDFTNFPAVGESLGAQALYQLLRVCLELNDVSGARDSLARIFQVHPTGELTDNSILLTGEGMTDLNQPTNALILFQKFKALSPNSNLLPEVDLAMARAYEQERDWPSAIGVYENWVRQFGTNALLLPQVEYARAWANFQAGNETNAFQLFTNFVAQFPNPKGLAPVAQWWVGDYFFRAGDFVDAEKNYKYIFQNIYSQSSLSENRSNLFYPAQLMAGRAAMGWGGYQDAKGYFTSLTADTNCPPELDVQALFAYGSTEMLMESTNLNDPLANFGLAVVVFKTICQQYPASEQAVLAQGEIGDCYLQLTNYDAATNAYAQVIASPQADISARSQAQIGVGIALEKMAALATGTNQVALFNQALDNYSDVLYKNNLRDGEQPDSFWSKNAGLSAAGLAERLGNFEVATNVYSGMETSFPPLKDFCEKKIAAIQLNLSSQKK